MTSRITRLLDAALQAITIAMIIALTCVILLGVAFRYSGNSLIWYDEVAVALLAWITFTGAALAGLRNAHLGFNGLLYSLPPGARISLFWIGEAIFVLTFALVAWAGWSILEVFGNETMTTLRFVPRAALQAILPFSAALMVVGRLLTLSDRIDAVRSGKDPETVEIEQEIARAEVELSRVKGQPR